MKASQIFISNKNENTPIWKVLLNMTIIIGAAALMVIVSLTGLMLLWITVSCLKWPSAFGRDLR